MSESEQQVSKGGRDLIADKTMKYPSDNDEGDVTMKHPSDNDEDYKF